MLIFNLKKVKDGVPVDESQSSGLKFYANQLERLFDSGNYSDCREVTRRYRVEPGNYLISNIINWIWV